MRLVLDTNIAVSALLWRGAPRQLLDQIIEDSKIELYASPILLRELSEVLHRPKFAQRLSAAGLTVEALLGTCVHHQPVILFYGLGHGIGIHPQFVTYVRRKHGRRHNW